MSIFNLLLQWVALLIPAWVIGLLFVTLARWGLWHTQWRCAWGLNVLAAGLLGTLTTVVSLVVRGEDGTVLGYALLVVTLACLQWCCMRR